MVDTCHDLSYAKEREGICIPYSTYRDSWGKSLFPTSYWHICLAKFYSIPYRAVIRVTYLGIHLLNPVSRMVEVSS